MENADRIYVKSNNGNKNTIGLLKFIAFNIPKINTVLGRNVQIFKVTPTMLTNITALEKLQEYGIVNLPALYTEGEFIFGVNNVKNYYKGLITSTQQQTQRPQQAKSLPSTQNETQLEEFYRDEIFSKEQENDGSADLDLSKRHRQAVTGRKPTVDPGLDLNRDHTQAPASKSRNKVAPVAPAVSSTAGVMASVASVTDGGGLDGDLERAFWENNIADE
jgi:hypothetical protein